MANYQEGRWPGKLLDYGIGETKAGEPQVELLFDVAFSTGAAKMAWRGSLKSDKAQEITFKALQALGFNGRINDLIDGPEGGALTLGAETSLVVENERWKDDKGQMRDGYKIRWVNAPGGGNGGQVKRADAATAKAKLLQLGVDGAWAKFKQLNPAAPKPAPAPAGGGDDDDIPF